MAWLTSKSELENKFTVGSIAPIDPDKPGPIDPDKPIKPDPDLEQKLNGNLYEPNWKPGSKLAPGVEIAKDPYVGVGKGSEESYVYVYVDSTMPTGQGNDVYFTINEGWEVVQATKGNEEGQYIEGLFKYTNGLTGSKDDKNTWTTKALFDKVVINDKADSKDFLNKADGTETPGSIKVQSFLHQMKDSDGQNIDEKTVVYPALEEAFGITLK